MGLWHSGPEHPTYRPTPIIDTGEHIMWEYRHHYNLACYMEGREMDYKGNTPDYCPYCGEEL